MRARPTRTRPTRCDSGTSSDSGFHSKQRTRKRMARRTVASVLLPWRYDDRTSSGGCTMRTLVAAFCTLAVTLLPLMSTAAAARDYDIVYVRQPRYGNTTNTTWPEVAHPASLEPGADLMLLHPDGSEELLVAGGNGAVTDPFVSFDGRFVYY